MNYEHEFGEALDLLVELSDQDCGAWATDEDTSYLNSNFIGVYADLLRFLGKHGRVFITGDSGRVVEGRRIGRIVT